MTWLNLGQGSDTLLDEWTLHNGMILSILSISSHGFALDFSKDLIPMMNPIRLIVNNFLIQKMFSIAPVKSNLTLINKVYEKLNENKQPT